MQILIRIVLNCYPNIINKLYQIWFPISEHTYNCNKLKRIKIISCTYVKIKSERDTELRKHRYSNN